MAALTPAQRTVLRAAADGKVWRNESMPEPCQWIVPDAKSAYRVANRTVESLVRRGLLAVGPSAYLHSYAAPTDAGRALLDTLNPEGR